LDKLNGTLGWLRGVLPAEFGVAGGPIGQPRASIYGDEEAIIGRAAAKRRYEFRAGRAFARMALSQIGGAPASIGRGGNGEPVWPTGYVGSISHTDDFAVTAVAPSDLCLGLGLDVTPVQAFEPALAKFVCRPEELARASIRHLSAADAVNLLFAAKEAFVKFHFATTRTLADFLDIDVTLDTDLAGFTAVPVNLSLPSLSSNQNQFRGYVSCREGMVAAVAFSPLGPRRVAMNQAEGTD
jgi:4'-phosphopantetheinyl transferase EntD